MAAEKPIPKGAGTYLDRLAIIKVKTYKKIVDLIFRRLLVSVRTVSDSLVTLGTPMPKAIARLLFATTDAARRNEFVKRATPKVEALANRDCPTVWTDASGLKRSIPCNGT